MKELLFILSFYDKEVSTMISNKYGYPLMEAVKKIIFFLKHTRCIRRY